VRDITAEQHHYNSHAVSVRRYRKVLPDEVDRGEMYPYFGNLRNLSHFGIGIGAYFMQLLVLPVVFFIVGKFVQNKSV
jgi:hypothetical protein